MTEHRHADSAVRPTALKRFIPLVTTLVLIAIATVALSHSQTPFRSVEVAFTDNSAHGMQIVPASCPSNPFDSAAPYGCKGSVPLCPNGITPAPNGNFAQCTCAEGNAAACTSNNPPGGNGGGLTENGNPVSQCDIGYTQEGRICVFTGCPTGYSRTGPNSNPSCIFVGCPSGYTQQGGQCIQNQCIQGYICGANGNLYLEQSDCSATLAQTCSFGCVGNACFIPPPAADIVAVPSVVRAGETTKISWQAKYVQSCTISGTDGDSWNCSGNSCSATTTKQSNSIQNQTTYTLNCLALDASHVTQAATVNIVPNFVEH